MNKDFLDFIIIGAQKAGTTSLFHYLKTHPRIYLPREKECPFFSNEDTYSKGWEWFIGEYYRNAPPDALWGKATPHYMIDPRAPERIWNILPRVKLIALLRNPIDRAYSQYRMSVRRANESRDFERAVDELLKPDALTNARRKPTETNGYIINGEYARILSGYREYFPPDQIAVFFTEEIHRRPGDVFRSILSFLDVSADFIPSNLGTVFHQGGTRHRWPWVNTLRQMPLARSIWRAVLPKQRRRNLRFWYEQWNIIPDEKVQSSPPVVRNLLAQHYEKDVKSLSALIGRETPWSDWIG